MLPLSIRLTLSAVVIVAAVTDARDRRIPNWLTLPALPVGLAMQGLWGEGWGQALGGALAGFLVFLLIFLAGGAGAGDVKLLTVVGAFVGARNFLPLFLLIAILGGIAAVGVALARGALGTTLRNTGSILAALVTWRWRELRERSDLDRPGAIRLAYGVVIAAATLVFLWLAQ